MEYAWGKVPDKIEFEDKTKIIDKASPSDALARLAALTEVVRRQSMNEAAVVESTSKEETDSDTTPPIIH